MKASIVWFVFFWLVHLSLFSVFFVLSDLCRLALVIIFSTYDTKCVIWEHASVADCNQNVDKLKPEVWIFIWVVVSVSSSLLLMICFYFKNYFFKFEKVKAKNVYKKGSCWSLFVLLLLTTGYYIFRASLGPSGPGRKIAIALCFWPGTMLTALLLFNFTPRVPCDCCFGNCSFRKCCSFCKNCCKNFRCSFDCCCQFFTKHAVFVLYWFALLIYFLESLLMWVAVAFDVAHEVAPLIEKQYEGDSWRFHGVVVFFIAFSFAFHSRMLSLYWNKIFHGDKDLLSEPCAKLSDTSGCRVENDGGAGISDIEDLELHDHAAN